MPDAPTPVAAQTAPAVTAGPDAATARPGLVRRLLPWLLVASLALNAWLALRDPGGARDPRSTSVTGTMIPMRTPGGLLEVSTVAAEERFDSTTQHTVLGVPVGKTIAQVRVPAVYRFHIPLATEWNLRLTGEALVVVAPPVAPSLPVAIDTSRLESFSAGLWSPFTGAEAVAALQRSITAQLAAKADSPALIALQRESARKTVAEFVEKWVLAQPRWQAVKAPTIFVFFADEPLGTRAAPLLAP